MKTVAEEINELRALGVPELVERYAAAFGRRPRVMHREWLWRRIAWKIQEQRFGGLTVTAKRHLDELIAGLDLPLKSERVVRGQVARPATKDPVLGTSVVRIWKNQEIRATSVEGGWEHAGVVHKSLSAVAKAVTGAHWNGRAFFGLTTRKVAP
jgi:hypothetical protein